MIFYSDNIDPGELQSLGGVKGQQVPPVGGGVAPAAGRERGTREEVIDLLGQGSALSSLDQRPQAFNSHWIALANRALGPEPFHEGPPSQPFDDIFERKRPGNLGRLDRVALEAIAETSQGERSGKVAKDTRFLSRIRGGIQCQGQTELIQQVDR